jgi:hypothetical protein
VIFLFGLTELLKLRLFSANEFINAVMVADITKLQQSKVANYVI